MKKGFTLIELAIVLVIIGILMGAILRGQALIKSAKEKNFFSKLRYIASAEFTYLERMGRYAGDSSNPPDGIIDGTHSPPTSCDCSSITISSNAWCQLVCQQLLQLNDGRHIFNGTFSLQGGVAPYPNYNRINATRVPCWVAQSIDIKIDDGVSNSGNIRWDGGAYCPTDPNSANTLHWWFDR